MKKIILIGLCIISLVVISGCVANNTNAILNSKLKEMYGEDLSEYKQSQELWDLKQSVSQGCLIDNCMNYCNIKIVQNTTDWDYNNNGEIDDLEFEMMELSSERKQNCLNECYTDGTGWMAYIDKCK